MRAVGMQAQQEELRRAIRPCGIAQTTGAARHVGACAMGSLRAVSRLRSRTGPRRPDRHQNARKANQGTQAPSTKEALSEERSVASASRLGAATIQAEAKARADEDLQVVRGGV